MRAFHRLVGQVAAQPPRDVPAVEAVGVNRGQHPMTAAPAGGMAVAVAGGGGGRDGGAPEALAHLRQRGLVALHLGRQPPLRAQGLPGHRGAVPVVAGGSQIASLPELTRGVSVLCAAGQRRHGQDRFQSQDKHATGQLQRGLRQRGKAQAQCKGKTVTEKGFMAAIRDSPCRLRSATRGGCA